MLIRSADKTKIVNLANVNLIEIVDSHREEYRYGIWIDECKAAEYKTFQRTIEVLNEICNAYIGLNSFKGNAPYVKNGIYQMPEE